ncbi:MAG: type ISP restriction/modification enzyme [Microcoleaceae cyanobacterium]
MGFFRLKLIPSNIIEPLGKAFLTHETADFIIESIDCLDHQHFGQRLADPGVEILDPCVGTGTYITALIEYLPLDSLEHKYKYEIHCNEILIFPYYFATLDIESAYQQRIGKYEEFRNICWVDTAEYCTGEEQQLNLFTMNVQNTARIYQQNGRKISVILGDLPRSNQAQTRFFRWASDRIGHHGIIAFTADRSLIHSKSFDQFRQRLEQEFNNIYVVDVQTEAIVIFLIKTHKEKGSPDAKIFHFTSKEKSTRFEQISFKEITPDQNHNWINWTDRKFDSFFPLVAEAVSPEQSKAAIFQLFSAGIKTGRDEWVYNFSQDALIERMQYVSEDNQFDASVITSALYRPFIPLKLYFDLNLINVPAQFSSIFPNGRAENWVICCTDVGSRKPFTTLAAQQILDVQVTGTSTCCFPLYRYEENGKSIENITDWALKQFRCHYDDEFQVSKFGAGYQSVSLDESPVTLWFVTLVTHNSRILEPRVAYGVEMDESVIFSAADQIFIAEKIGEVANRYRIDIATFNVLPDHAHLVVAAETETELNQIIGKLMDHTAHQFHRLQNWQGNQRVWAEGFDLQPIEDQAELMEILDYTWSNHLIHAERWEEDLLSTWQDGVPDLGLRPLAEIMREGCVPLVNLLSEDADPMTRDWDALPKMFREITKLDIFHYTYAVLHHPVYRAQYELNLKREFPRLPFYPNFQQWVTWGKTLMALHLNYETVKPYGFRVIETEQAKARKSSKPKLKADKESGQIILDAETTLTGIPSIAWDYQLGDRSALEWVLHQYKEKKPRDPTIREQFNRYKFADYKERVIDLLQRVCTVSVRTMEILKQMPEEA